MTVPLHPQASAYIDWTAKQHVPQLSALSPAQARIWDAKVTALLTKGVEPVVKVEDMKVPSFGADIPIRRYNPKTRASSAILLFFHGGGWVLGSVDQVDYPCRLLANKTQGTVVSVDYRVAPEHKFPVPLEDCYALTKWVAENANRLGGSEEHLIVCGDSAGGNLAAAVSLMAKDRGGPSIASQILIYPIVDLLDDSYRDFPDKMSPALTKDDMIWFINHYKSRDDDLKNEYASPLRRADLTGLPSTLLITAEFDILTKQCNAYADKLRKAGVHVHSVHYPGLIHGFFTLPDMFDAAGDSMKRIAEELGSLSH